MPPMRSTLLKSSLVRLAAHRASRLNAQAVRRERSARPGSLRCRVDEGRPLLRGALELPRDAAADQVAQRIDGFVRDAVDGAVAAAFACDQPVLTQQPPEAQDVGPQ